MGRGIISWRFSDYWSNCYANYWIDSGRIKTDTSNHIPSIYWQSIDPKLGLAIGAVAGVGFGILKAQSILNTSYISGSMNFAQIWEVFLLVAIHISTCAIAGYGMYKGQGGRFYLLAALLFAIMSYIPYLIIAPEISAILVQILLTFWAILVTGVSLWIRWKN